MPFNDRAMAYAWEKSRHNKHRQLGLCERCNLAATINPKTGTARYCDWHREYSRIKGRLCHRRKSLKENGTIKTYGGNWSGDMRTLSDFGIFHPRAERLKKWAEQRAEAFET